MSKRATLALMRLAVCCLFLVVCAPWASADSIASILSSCVSPGVAGGEATPLVAVAGQFSAVECNLPGASNAPTTAIVDVIGPAGLETFVSPIFGPLDEFRSFYLNDSGEFVTSVEVTADRSSYFGIYRGAGVASIGSGSFLPGSTTQGDTGSFALAPGPTIPGYFQDLRSADALSSILMTGLSDNGVASGIETIAYLGLYNNFLLEEPVSWQVSVPIPSTLTLFATGILMLVAFKLVRPSVKKV